MFTPTTYRAYEEYSTQYIIDLESLDQYVTTVPDAGNRFDLIEQWLQEHCYYIVPTHLIPDFLQKINHNLLLAKQAEDHEYVRYICKKLSIEINTETWLYTPNKIKIKLKSATIKDGIRISVELSQLLSIEIDRIYKYKNEVIRLVHRYIYQNQLQNRFDRKCITPNDQLQAVLIPLKNGDLEYTYTNLGRYIPIEAVV